MKIIFTDARKVFQLELTAKQWSTKLPLSLKTVTCGKTTMTPESGLVVTNICKFEKLKPGVLFKSIRNTAKTGKSFRGKMAPRG